jgi:hypothetical protein
MKASIDPILLASKLAALQRRELPKAAEQLDRSPWIRELLCLIQWFSAQPGGLEGLARRVISLCPEHLGPTEPGGHSIQVAAILELLPVDVLCRPTFLGNDNAWWFDLQRSRTRQDLQVEHLGPPLSKTEVADRDRRLSARMGEISLDAVLSACSEAALDRLPEYFHGLCSDMHFGAGFDDPSWWCFRRPLAALRKFAAEWAATQLAQLAQTEVSERILGGLDYAYSERRSVWVSGLHRRGKTHTVEIGCLAYPGRARYVRVPGSETDTELYRRVAKSLLIPYSLNTPASRLRETIAEVLDATGVCLVLDEAQFLYGPAANGSTRPARLEWCRELIDTHIPCVICTSPQSYDQAERVFFKKTGYPRGQWLGRWIRRIEIPDLLDDKDLLSVARKHFPTASDRMIAQVAGRAATHHGYLKAIDEVRAYAGYLSKRREPAGEITAALIEEALN